MMRVNYFDPRSERTVENDVESFDQVADLITLSASLRPGCGARTVEIIREDGSSLGVSSDGLRAFLVWVDPLFNSYHSVGGMQGDDFVFDYWGSWSEAPADQLVPVGEVASCVKVFMDRGSPDTETVLFSPD